MFTSRTSVGVQERSASSSTVFVSEEPLCCCAWRRLDSRRDSICSWQARKQSCRRVQCQGRDRETQEGPLERGWNSRVLTKQGKWWWVIWESSRLGRAGAPSWMSKPIFFFFSDCTAASLPMLFTSPLLTFTPAILQ